MALPRNKSEWNTYTAIAWLPDAELGHRGSKWSMGVDVRKGKEFVGSFCIGKGGVTFVKKYARDRKKEPKGKRVTWRELAKIIQLRKPQPLLREHFALADRFVSKIGQFLHINVDGV